MTGMDEKAIADRWSLMRGALNEAQRRLWLGVEAQVLGGRNRGIDAVARATKTSPTTVESGLDLVDALGLERPDVFHPHVRVRRLGAGRKPLREKSPELVPTLMKLLEPEKVLGGESPLIWATKTRARLVEELAARGFRVSGSTLLELLREEGFRIGRTDNRQRDAHWPQPRDQFAFVSRRVALAKSESQPVVAIELFRVSRTALVTDGAPTFSAGLRQRRDDRFEDEDRMQMPDARCEVCGSTRHDPGKLALPSSETIDFAVVALEQWWKHEVDVSTHRAARIVVVVAGFTASEQAMRQIRGRLTVARRSMQIRLEVLHMPEGIRRWRNAPRRFTLATNDYVIDRSLQRHEIVLEFPGEPRSTVNYRHSESHSRLCGVSTPVEPTGGDGFAEYPDWNYALTDE